MCDTNTAPGLSPAAPVFMPDRSTRRVIVMKRPQRMETISEDHSNRRHDGLSRSLSVYFTSRSPLDRTMQERSVLCGTIVVRPLFARWPDGIK